jgi:hypothetical protein
MSQLRSGDPTARSEASNPEAAVAGQSAPPACAIDPDVQCPVCAARGERVQMLPIKAHYQCPKCRYFDSCCM